MSVLAWLLLIAHAVIPHHHHSLNVCLQLHNNSADIDSEMYPIAHDHGEDETDPICCNLIDLNVVPNNQGKQEIVKLETDFIIHNWFSVTPENVGLMQINTDSPFKWPFLIIRHNSLYYEGLRTLRGPPSKSDYKLLSYM